MNEDRKKANKIASSLLNLGAIDELKSLKKEELVSVIVETAGRFGKLKSELQNVVKYANEGNKIRKDNEVILANNKKLVDANIQQSTFIQKLQKENAKLEGLKSTISFQESVILKLQALLESKITHHRKGDKSGGAEDGTGSAAPNNILSQHPALRKSLEAVETSGEVSDLRAKVAELSEKLAGYERLKDNVDASNTTRKIYRLEAELVAKDVKIQALENQLNISAKHYSDEISALKMKLFELELASALENGTRGRAGDVDNINKLFEEGYIDDDDNDPELDFANFDLNGPPLFELYNKKEKKADGFEDFGARAESSNPDKLRSKSSWKDLNGPNSDFTGGGVQFGLAMVPLPLERSNSKLVSSAGQSSITPLERNNSKLLPSGPARNAANILRTDSSGSLKASNSNGNLSTNLDSFDH